MDCFTNLKVLAQDFLNTVNPTYVAITIMIIVIILVIWLCIAVNNDLLNQRHPFESKVDPNEPIPYTFYWINLDTAKERFNNITQLFNKYNIKNKRIEAIRGGPTQYDKEIACSKSHVKAIKTFYESGESVGFICEDDLTMEYKNYWRQSLQQMITNAPADWEIIQLAIIPCYCTDNNWLCSCYPFYYVRAPTENYIPYNSWVSSALCYAINRKGARKIIHSNNQPTNIAESFLFLQCKTYTLKYPMFTYPTKNDSTLHPDHLYGHVLSKQTVTDYLSYQ